ncbi:MAG: hypothetical protein VX017_03860 [Pseudomonadota bacterium]|nr:hypothetical protein [Pseudomonadota bacterium]
MLQIGLGGYDVGRSVEKISPQINAIAGASPSRTKPSTKIGAKTHVKGAAGAGHVKSG